MLSVAERLRVTLTESVVAVLLLIVKEPAGAIASVAIAVVNDCS